VSKPAGATPASASNVVTVIEILERHPPRDAAILLLIGPGAAGKSCLGAVLAPLLGRTLIDLDGEFLQRIGNIDAFIRAEGYGRYKMRNSLLAGEIVGSATGPALLVASSGFLTADNPPQALEANRALLASSYSLCLLPARSPEIGMEIIVARQLGRSFSRGREREEAVIRDRYPVYAALGDMILFSADSPAEIAQAVAGRLLGRI
jgi:shikimate kinase